MAIVDLETELPASIDRIWAEVRRPRLLQHVAAGLVTFRPVEPPSFPELW